MKDFKKSIYSEHDLTINNKEKTQLAIYIFSEHVISHKSTTNHDRIFPSHINNK